MATAALTARSIQYGTDYIARLRGKDVRVRVTGPNRHTKMQRGFWAHNYATGRLVTIDSPAQLRPVEPAPAPAAPEYRLASFGVLTFDPAVRGAAFRASSLAWTTAAEEAVAAVADPALDARLADTRSALRVQTARTRRAMVAGDALEASEANQVVRALAHRIFRAVASHQVARPAAPAPALERTERRANGLIIATLTGAPADVDAAAEQFVATWGYAYGARVESRATLADGRARVQLSRYASAD